MRKKLLFPVLAVLLLIGFNSCKLGDGENYTPSLGLFDKAIRNSTDTLNLSYTSELNIQIDSTIYQNDTVTLFVIANAYGNKLKQFNYIVTESTSIDIILPDSIKTLFEPESEFESGKYIFHDNIVFMSFPFQFIAKEASGSVKIMFSVMSDAEKVANMASCKIEFPIKEWPDNH